MFKKTILATLIVAFAMAGCAQKSDKISATPTSTAPYESLSCNRLLEERNEVVRQVNEVAGEQDKAASSDAAKMTVGLILFWPSLFFIRGNKENAAKLSALRGQYEAITEVGISKGCWEAEEPTSA